MTLQEALDIFTTPITTFKRGRILQKVILALSAPVEEDAAKRSLSILEQTELRSLFLNLYPKIELEPTDYVNVNTIIEINTGLIPYNKEISRAISELGNDFPFETLDLLKDYLVKEAPTYQISVATFVVMAMTLLEAGEM